jgi:heme-degrading monooxygenase HmoA
MIHEVAAILIRPGMAETFEQAFCKALPLFQRASGCRGVRLERSVEDPLKYLTVIGWERLEDHVEGFRNSADHGRWRDLVGGCFAMPPTIDHTESLIEWPGN